MFTVLFKRGITMSEENQSKPVRQVLLTSDQFEISDDGEVVIKSDEVAEALQWELAQPTPAEAGTVSVKEVSVGVKIGIG